MAAKKKGFIRRMLDAVEGTPAETTVAARKAVKRTAGKAKAKVKSQSKRAKRASKARRAKK